MTILLNELSESSVKNFVSSMNILGRDGGREGWSDGGGGRELEGSSELEGGRDRGSEGGRKVGSEGARERGR